MALQFAMFDGGATAASFAATLGNAKKQFRQFTIYADPDNSGDLYFGLSTVTGVPANQLFHLKAGLSMNLGPQDSERPFIVDTSRWYVVGSAASQKCYFIVNTDDGRR